MHSARFRHRSAAASLAAILPILISVAPPSPAAAQDFELSATPVPATPESGDAFVLEVRSVCCSSGLLSLDSEVTVEEGVIRVDTVRECGPLAALMAYEYAVAVPPLAAGEYRVEVRASGGGCGDPAGEPEITGSLTVEPEGALSGTRCTPGVEPAATLLFPYFEVDPSSPAGITTLVAITNTLAEPVLAKVVLWSDLALAVGSFHVYLAGYDVQTLNLRDVLAGRLPETGPSDAAAPPGCDPGNVAGPFDDGFAAAALRGDGSLLDCWSSSSHPERAVGYLTVDVVDACSPRVPGDAGYFGAGGSGEASNTNALLGELILAETGESFAQGTPAVHLVADDTAFEPGDFTFYGRYVGLDASDARMPLGRIHAVRYVENEAFDGGTELLVWRDVLVPAPGPLPCRLPNPTPLTWLDPFASVDVFDEAGSRTGLVTHAFPFATQRVPASSLGPIDSGWLRMELRGQAAALSVIRALGRFSVGTGSGQLDDPCATVRELAE